MNLFCGHSVPFSQTWPASGSMRSGVCSERPPLVLPTSVDVSSSSPGLPTPRARDARGKGFSDALPNVVQLLPTPTVSEANGIGHAADGGMNLRHTISLLPTSPGVRPANAASGCTTPEDSAPDATTAPTLNSGAPMTLLPTPRASENENRQTKRTPSQEAGTHGKCLAAEVAHLLPTPTATPYGNNQSTSAGAAVRPSLDSLAPTLLPTPTVADSRGTRNHRPDGSPYSSGDLTLPSAANRMSRGASTSPPSNAGSPSSDAPPLGPPTLWDD